ncbi:MAG: DUF4364 family protein [Clostridiales bacterium]|nr:DUF4364 family protein [Clostridiales bacterium]
MPLTLPKRKISDAENKLRLLCCVDALGMVTPAQLWPFVASLEMMEYLPMQLLLHELLAEGDVEEGTQALSQQVFITEKGRKALRLFGQRVMVSDRDRIRTAAAAYRAQLRRKAQVRTVYEMAQAGDYRVLLSLQEGELPLLTLRLFTEHRDVAAQAMKRFESQASAILSYFYGFEEKKGAKQGEAVPAELQAGVHQAEIPAPELISHSRHEHTVTALLPHEKGMITLSMLLPDLFSAKTYQRLLANPRIAGEAAGEIMGWLGGKEEPESR